MEEEKLIKTLTQLEYANAEGTEFIATVVLEKKPELGEIPMRFFDGDSSTPHVREGLERIRAGEFGDPAPYVAPTQEELDAEAAQDMRNIREIIFRTEVDPVVTNPLRWASLSSEEQAAWSQYRTDLLNISEQSGFPHNVIWPTKPE